ncbi:hypothetical protein [Paracoccus sp. JM45]|uniref:hypothetical protein n=1 Tax=Paracoccus sp. JM45 TaxID=2283626 RepID=UPI000E6C9E8B|nr:hypothetical protein [Paracoccus sp. JM45]RJE78722.1 hypothetical protein DWB67_15975 [Paracoccus sp. JM45]
MTTSFAIIVFVIMAVLGVVIALRMRATRTVAPRAADAPADNTHAVLDSQLFVRLDELRAEFGQDTALLMVNAAIEDLNRHLDILEGKTTPPEDETLASVRKRSLHSIVGIAGTLGCHNLSDCSSELYKKQDASLDEPASFQNLVKDVRALRSRLLAVMTDDQSRAVDAH